MKAEKVFYALAVYGALSLMPALAGAQDTDNYITVSGGLGWAADVERTVGNGSRIATIEYDSPYGFGAAYGHAINSWLRVEGELSFIEAGIDEVTGHFGQETDEVGRDRFYNMMVNALANFKNSTDFTPFVGAGIGAVYAQHDVTFDPDIVDNIPAVESNDYEWAFGYQMLAGVGWEFKPGITMDIMYRFFGVESREYSQDNVLISNVELESTSIHMVMLGVRYCF